MFHHRREPLPAQRPEHHGHLDHVRAARGAQRAVEPVGQPGGDVVVGTEVVDVHELRPERVTCRLRGEGPDHFGVGHREQTGGHRQPAELVQIQGDAAGPLDTRERTPEAVAEQGRAPVGRVDVQPSAVRVRDVGDGVQRIDHPGVGGPGGGHHHERAGDPGQQRGQGGGIEPAAGGRDDARRTQAEQPTGPSHRVMGVGRADELQVRAEPLASEQQPDQVRLGAARGDQRRRGDGGGEHQPRHDRGDLVLQGARGGGLVPGVHRLVQCAHREVRGDGDRERWAVQMPDAPRVSRVRRTGGQRRHDPTQGVLGQVTRLGQDRTDGVAHLPDRSVGSAARERAAALRPSVVEGTQHHPGQVTESY